MAMKNTATGNVAAARAAAAPSSASCGVSANPGGRARHHIFSEASTHRRAELTTKRGTIRSTRPWLFGTGNALGVALLSIPAIGLVLGGASNPFVVGLASGLLVTVLLWRIGSAPKKRHHGGTP
jgi:hypothetical protein